MRDDKLHTTAIAHWATVTRSMLRSWSPDERAVFFGVLRELFCVHCGHETPSAIRCQCERR